MASATTTGRERRMPPPPHAHRRQLLTRSSGGHNIVPPPEASAAALFPRSPRPGLRHSPGARRALSTKDPRRSGFHSRGASIAEIVPGLGRFVAKERFRTWASSFRRLDPRYQILEYFNDVATSGAKRIETDGVPRSSSLPPRLAPFKRSGVFSVWRPTSNDAIKKMMAGEGTGKGLDIKGKSAKKRALSGYVPFVQIHDDDHRRAIGSLPRDARIRVFYGNRTTRDAAAETLKAVSAEMAEATERDSAVMRNRLAAPADRDEALTRLAWWDVADPSVTVLDEYEARGCFGVEIAERLFWEAYVMRESIVREPGSAYETGRASEPDFQSMNFKSTRTWSEAGGGPRPVVWHHADPDVDEPMCPKRLLVAYEEDGRVLPVVSDFDCFLVGTRGISFEPLEPSQVERLKWCLDNIEHILDGPDTSHGWPTRWFNVLKSERAKKMPAMPKYGFGDSKSYSIVENAVKRLKENGAVRHGAECFNYFFPQDLDKEFLVVSDALPGKIPWAKMNQDQLKDFLLGKIDEGYSFPLNPKWVLCDGWKDVYDKLLAEPRAKEAMDAWFPPESGLREKIDAVSARHPVGFLRRAFDGLVTEPEEIERLSTLPALKRESNSKDMIFDGNASLPLTLHHQSASMDAGALGHSSLQFFHPNRELSNGAKPPPRLSFPAPLKHRSRSISTHKEMKVVATLERQGSEGTSAMDLAMLELERHDAVVRAKRKLKTLFIWIGAAQKARERRESAELGGDSPASAAASAAADGAISGSAHGIKPPAFSRLESMPEDAVPPPAPLPGDASPLTASMKKDYEAFSSQFCGASTRASVPAPPPAMSPLSPPRSKRPAWSYTMGTDSFKLA